MKQDIFNIVTGDIFKLKADALVFPANHKPMIGGSVDGQIYECAGAGQLLEQRVAHGYLHGGESCITESFDMSCNYQYLIHTATPKYDPNHPRSSMHDLKKCYLSSLELAEENNLKTIVFVLLGAGVSGFLHNKAIEAAETAVQRYFTDHSDSLIERVTVVEYENESQYQLLIQCNQKLKEVKDLLAQIKYFEDSIQINSYIACCVTVSLVYASRKLKQLAVSLHPSYLSSWIAIIL